MVPHFIMTVGLPASGKTYFAEAHDQTYMRFSSDHIRNQLFPDGDGYTKEHQAIVFKKLGDGVKKALHEGYNTIYDATNMSRKRRMAFLQELKNIECVKDCYLFVEPLWICKIRNKFREEEVPDEVYSRMIRRFCVPTMREGWDSIRLFHSYECYDDKEFLRELLQHNEHHSLTLGDHCEKAAEILRKDPRFKALNSNEKILVATAMEQHDIGKTLTMTKTNAKGVNDGNYHYYGHHHAGAYLALTDGRNFDTFGMQILDLALLIELHMRPFDWAKNPKLKTKDRKLYGDWVINAVEMIHDANVAAH